MAERTDAARTEESPTVVVPYVPRDMQYLKVACSECGALVDQVEYDAAAGPSPAVATAMAMFGMNEKKARAMIEEHNPDALASQEEQARALAEQIRTRSVPDRDAETYACRNGHDAELEVTG